MIGLTDLSGREESEARAATPLPKTDPEAIKDLDPTYLAALQKRDWLEPSFADQTFAVQTAEQLDLHLATALRLEREEFSGRDYSAHRKYLYPDRELIVAPDETVPGMSEAAAHVWERLQAGEKIAVFADYDNDGIMSAAVLSRSLDEMGVPEKQSIFKIAKNTDGFGLTPEFVEQAHAAGASVLITVDNGSKKTSEIERAHQLGMSTVVIDHHDVDLDNPAQYHLNPNFIAARKAKQAQEELEEAKALLKQAREVKERWTLAKAEKEEMEKLETASPEERETNAQRVRASQEELEEFKTRALASMQRLDEISGLTPGVDQPSRDLGVAIERAAVRLKENTVVDSNSGAQLTWKFAAELHRQAEGEVPESHYQERMYLAGVGALADMMEMNGKHPENRAFCRIPVDEAVRDGRPIPSSELVRRLAEHYGNEVDDPGSHIRPRAAGNLAKRTLNMDGDTILAASRSDNPRKVRPLAKKMIEEAGKSTLVREQMKEEVVEDFKRRRESFKDKHGAEPLVVSGVVRGYPEYVGQVGVIASQMVKEHGVPAIIAHPVGETADGKTLLKFSGRGSGKSQMGRALRDASLKKACTFQERLPDGKLVESTSVGGHSDVVSGMCTEENYPEVVKVFQRLGEQTVRSERYGWHARKSGSGGVWISKRKVNPADLPRLEREAQLIRPTTNRNYPTRISLAARAENIGPLDPDRNTHPATLVLANGETRQADIEPSALPALKTGTFWEIAVSLGEKRYWVRDLRPL